MSSNVACVGVSLERRAKGQVTNIGGGFHRIDSAVICFHA